MNDNTIDIDVDFENHPALEWAELRDLEPGEAYCLGIESPWSYVLVGKYVGRYGRQEYDVSCLVGPAGGRAYTRTFWNPTQEVLIIPPAEVGPRLSAAVDAHRQRRYLGAERISLRADTWPWSVLAGELEHEDTSNVVHLSEVPC